MSVVSGFYTNVINEVIESLKIQFNEEGIDPAVLNDLKEIWEKKLKDSGALDPVKHNVQSASHFSAVMQPSDISRNNSIRMPTLSNPTSRLIKPSGQGSVMPEQTYSAPRMAVPVLLQQGNNFRPVPMVINTNPQHGLPMFSQYHNIITPNHGTQIITDNNVVNLRKNQVDGNDDGSSEDEEGDFVNVSEVDPQSVRPPMSNVPATPTIFKKETKEEETDEDLVEEEIENLNHHHDMSVKHEHSDEDDEEENDDDDEADEPQNEEEPLNSEDDISDDDPEKIFEADNVIVCQYEKVNRTRNKWKLNFVSGIANLQGKDSVFHKAVGEAEW